MVGPDLDPGYFLRATAELLLCIAVFHVDLHTPNTLFPQSIFCSLSSCRAMLASLDIQSLALGASLPPLIWVALKALAALRSTVRPDVSPHNYKVQCMLLNLKFIVADTFTQC